MTRLTLAIDDRVLDEAREVAARRHTTVDALVEDYLAQLASEEGRMAKARQRLLELMETSTLDLGPDFKWNREELYEERMFPRHQRPAIRGGGEGA